MAAVQLEIKLKSGADLVLEVLRRSRGAWVPHLYAQTGVMVHSRVAELRKRGYQIEAKCFGRGDYRYKLIAEPTVEHT